MSRARPDPRSEPGCLTAAAAAAGLVALAPWVALVRWWRRLRRGSAAMVRWKIEGDRPLTCFDLSVDVPTQVAGPARRELVDTVVRVAEHLRQPDDLYHLVWRETGQTETNLVAVGPTPQGLAQRLDTALAHRSFEGRTQVWLTLPRGTHLAELLDPFDFDPEGRGAATLLVQRSDPRWAMELSFARRPPSVVIRLRLHVPAGSAGRVEEVLARLRRRLEGPVSRVATPARPAGSSGPPPAA